MIGWLHHFVSHKVFTYHSEMHSALALSSIDEYETTATASATQSGDDESADICN